jgi:hypothetical protein
MPGLADADYGMKETKRFLQGKREWNIAIKYYSRIGDHYEKVGFIIIKRRTVLGNS